MRSKRTKNQGSKLPQRWCELGLAAAASLAIPTVLCCTPSQADAAVGRAYNLETAVCTVVWKAPYDPNRGIAPANPIESLPYLPAVCSSQSMSRADIRDGIRSLLALGWRAVNASHQTTVVGTSKDGTADLLISAIFTLELERQERSR